jgi:L-amino acid N-acyltransferase YncA
MSFTLEWRPLPEPAERAAYANVTWDSDLYGFPFYELRCEDADAETLAAELGRWLAGLAPAQPCLVYTKIPTTAVRLGRILTRQGFYPVETMVDLSLTLNRMALVSDRPFAQAHLRPATEADLPALRATAAAAFSHDRLHLDTNLPAAKADERFAQWVERGWRAGEPLLVFEDRRGAKLIGFFHLRETAPGTIDLSLAGVAPALQRSGLGAVMYQAVLTDCRSRGYRIATTRISVNNIDIVNLFARLGFAFHRPVLTLHWFRPAA